jgi:ligand-binding sensor domain-containing protein
MNDIDNENYHIKHYFFDNKVLSGDDILSLFQDKKGTIWIGTKAKGLFSYNGKSFHKINIKKEETEVTSIHSISEDANNNLWMSSNFGIINNTPITISITPKAIKNDSGEIKGMVLLRSAVTSALAGLVSRTFKIPKQKYTRNIAKRERGVIVF